ncbi:MULTISPECIES: AAA domain-containing protein [Aminobacterium]|jgi:hypothetical protein|uniref:AAA domain-containing protein n=1 Tax=Aminobacterium TaxID=81466 RepID=UPI002580DB10|nr:AAA domain-containing protein [Aminobacterium sp. UBA4987]
MNIPTTDVKIAEWFNESILKEIDCLQREGANRSYELLSGKVKEKISENQLIMVFSLADGLRIPEDARGKIKFEGEELTATVLAQNGDRITILLEGFSLPENGLFRSMFIIDTTENLRLLSERLEEISQKERQLESPFPVKIFHPLDSNNELRSIEQKGLLPDLDEKTKKVIDACCSKEVSYLWGPPGTGKTFVISQLISRLIENGERVILMSHTNTAVDNALIETYNRSLKDSRWISKRKVIRIGKAVKNEVPEEVQLDWIIEERAKDIKIDVMKKELQLQKVQSERKMIQSAIESKQKELALVEKVQEMDKQCNSFQGYIEHLKDVAKGLEKERLQLEEELQKARNAWLFKNNKIKRANDKLENVRFKLQMNQEEIDIKERDLYSASDTKANLENQVRRQKQNNLGIPDIDSLIAEQDKIQKKIEEYQAKIQELRQKLDLIMNDVIEKARLVCCTLTKNYRDYEFKDEVFDAVIVDEISMALPPLLFLAAARGRKRVILVGDFLQLPPIVQSEDSLVSERLGVDVFHLSGLVKDFKPVRCNKCLVKLDTQRRMLPQIAEVARDLVYVSSGLKLKDHSVTKNRLKDIDNNKSIRFLSPNPLTIVDTSDLKCWCGKQSGSLSRFNLYSAKLAVEIASFALKEGDLSCRNDENYVAIVTPYSAQKRLINKLLQDMDMDKNVAAGTVHTFQGGQAEIVIFDSVLENPYWSSRLTTPKDTKDVKRDFNVAVTRAKNKFIFLGSSEWLNSHAKNTSAMGQFWEMLVNKADLISVDEFYQSCSSCKSFNEGMNEPLRLPLRSDFPSSLVILDESNFFDYFLKDLSKAQKSIFGLAPFFGEYRWSKIQPFIHSALQRGVEVTILTPPLGEASNASYVKNVVRNLRDCGAVVHYSSGLHGKDIIIDEKIIYTGSLNWSSSRGRTEIMRRFQAPEHAKLTLEFLQAKHIRKNSFFEDGSARVCPLCGSELQIVNQKRQHGKWDQQPFKYGCTNKACEGYLRSIEERAPFINKPVCQKDGKTKYRLKKVGRGEKWFCPKHPKGCPSYKYVVGDLEINR